MKCQKCSQNEATIHASFIAEDKMQSLDLCESCAQTRSVMDPEAIPLDSLIKALEDSTGNSLESLLSDSGKKEEPPRPEE